MKYLEFGESKQQASVIGVGCMRIAGMDYKTADEFVRGALEEGINFFDHADIYGGGRSEEVFGELFAAQPSLRDQVVLQSKCAITNGTFDFSKEHILASVDGILQRLHTDHLDSLLLHRPDVLMEPDEVQEAFEILKTSGKVLNFGVSNMNRYQMDLLKTGVKYPITANQLQMSMVHTPMIDAGLNVNMSDDPAVMRDGGTLEYCRMNDIIVQTWSPLQKGFFTGVFLGSDEFPELNALIDQIAEEQGVSADAVAYAWLLRYPARMQVITGTTKVERLKKAAEAVKVTLSRKQWYELYKAGGKRLP